MHPYFVSKPSLAQSQGGGNGGDAVVCFTDLKTRTIKSAESFDLWEMRIGGNFVSSMGSDNSAVEQKVEYALSKIEKFEPIRATDLRARYEKMKLSRKFVSEATLAEINDATSVLIPINNCFLQQAVIQRRGTDPLFAKFLFNKSIYDSMTNDSKAALELHEILYWKELDESDLNNSDGVRKYIGLITSTAMDNMDPKLYRTLTLAYLQGDRPAPEFFNPGDYDFILKAPLLVGYDANNVRFISYKNDAGTNFWCSIIEASKKSDVIPAGKYKVSVSRSFYGSYPAPQGQFYRRPHGGSIGSNFFHAYFEGKDAKFDIACQSNKEIPTQSTCTRVSGTTYTPVQTISITDRRGNLSRSATISDISYSYETYPCMGYKLSAPENTEELKKMFSEKFSFQFIGNY